MTWSWTRAAGRDATGQVVWSRGRNSLPVAVGQKITLAGAYESRQLTVVGIATSVTGTAQAWVVPAEIPALHGPGVAQMLYRFAAAGSVPQINADIAEVRAALPPGALLGAPVSYLTVRQQAAAQIAPFVPFILAFGVIALAMSVLIVVNVISGAVVAGTRRIGVLKSIGFTPGQVVAAYVLQAVIPAMIGCAAGAVCGDLLSEPLLSLNGPGVRARRAVHASLGGRRRSAGDARPDLRRRGGARDAGREDERGAGDRDRAGAAAVRGYAAHRLLGRAAPAAPDRHVGLAAPFARPTRTP